MLQRIIEGAGCQDSGKISESEFLRAVTPYIKIEAKACKFQVSMDADKDPAHPRGVEVRAKHCDVKTPPGRSGRQRAASVDKEEGEEEGEEDEEEEEDEKEEKDCDSDDEVLCRRRGGEQREGIGMGSAISATGGKGEHQRHHDVLALSVFHPSNESGEYHGIAIVVKYDALGEDKDASEGPLTARENQLLAEINRCARTAYSNPRGHHVDTGVRNGFKNVILCGRKEGGR